MNQSVFALVLAFFVTKVRAEYGQEVAQRVRVSAKQEFREILPHVPKVGGFRNYFAGITVANAATLPLSAQLRDGDRRPSWAILGCTRRPRNDVALCRRRLGGGPRPL